MSEYQRIAFRAVDAPVSEKNLEFMHKQSSRAEITPWSFDNEYSYADFRGNAFEMLRRGYDFFLHYANFGTRSLYFRLPNGLPDAASPYLRDEGMTFVADKKGTSGILQIDPAYEAGQLDDLWEVDELIDRLIPLRAEILQGDLRSLYIADLAFGQDLNHHPDEFLEPPVPAGLGKPTDAQRALLEFYGLNVHVLAAAAEASPPMTASTDSTDQHGTWLSNQPATAKDAWLADLMADPRSSVRREILAEFQKSASISAWPTAPGTRTMSQLEVRTGEIMDEAKRKKKEKEERDRAKHLAKLATDPRPALEKTEQLIQSKSYKQIADLLCDLREALRDTSQVNLAEEQAKKLNQKHPTLRTLTGELQRKGLLKKK